MPSSRRSRTPRTSSARWSAGGGRGRPTWRSPVARRAMEAEARAAGAPAAVVEEEAAAVASARRARATPRRRRCGRWQRCSPSRRPGTEVSRDSESLQLWSVAEGAPSAYSSWWGTSPTSHCLAGASSSTRTPSAWPRGGPCSCRRWPRAGARHRRCCPSSRTSRASSLAPHRACHYTSRLPSRPTPTSSTSALATTSRPCWWTVAPWARTPSSRPGGRCPRTGRPGRWASSRSA
mmetsp:Transcript_99719/g.321511  ORF Transcript_99719/g.321511 Transcript_99719/m.321511 type:complete len:235 (+) Transcript_99719:582-1286(+)